LLLELTNWIETVYDVSNRSTFEHLQVWFNELETYSSTREVVKMIVGNKSDKESTREVPRKDGEALARKAGTLFIETSAKTKSGVQDAFVEVVRKIIETPELWQKAQTTRPGTVNVNEPQGDDGANSCAC
jgi:Ras-related protein Rab-18